MNEKPDLNLRNLRTPPKQERARQTVQTIVQTAGALLAEVGIEDFNTNLLAERSGLRVRTIYRYFESKYDLISALYEFNARGWEEQWFPEGGRFETSSSDWREAYSEMVQRFLDLVSKTPGAIEVIRAVQYLPELKKLDQDVLSREAAKMQASFRKRNAKGTDSELYTAAFVILTSLSAAIEAAERHSDEIDSDLIAAAIEMHLCYMQKFFD